MSKLKGIYLIEFDNGIKVGISDDIKKRLLTYKQPWCREIRNALYIECQYPRIVEQRVKDFFQDFILKPSHEFFENIDLSTLKEYIINNRFARKDGVQINRYYKKIDKWTYIIPKIHIIDPHIKRYKYIKQAGQKKVIEKELNNKKTNNIAHYDPEVWEW